MKHTMKKTLALMVALMLALSTLVLADDAAVAPDANGQAMANELALGDDLALDDDLVPDGDLVLDDDLVLDGLLPEDAAQGSEEEIPEAEPLTPPDWAIEAELEGETDAETALAANVLGENSTWANLGDEINSEETVKLEKSYIAGEGDTRLLKTTASTTLDLNGHTLDRNLKSGQDNGGVIAVCGGKDSRLTITDSGSNGKITGGNTNGAGGGVKLDNVNNLGPGYLTLKSGNITGNHAASNGGGVAIFDGSELTMDGGSITNNTTNGQGGGVYIDNGCTFLMENGRITDNCANGNGGGVYVLPYSIFLLYNTGTVQITGNTKGGKPNNVYLADGAKITIQRLSKYSQIGVSMEKPTDDSGVPIPFTEYLGYQTSRTNPDDLINVFQSDDDDYAVDWFPKDTVSNDSEAALYPRIKCTANDQSIEYDGKAHGIEVKNIVGPKGKTVPNSEIKYGTSAGGCTEDESPTVKYVSEKTVYFKITATNYYPAAGSAKVKITPRTVALDWSGKDVYTYNGQAQGPGAKIKSTSIVGSDKVGVTVKYKAKGADDSTLTDKKPVDAGEYVAVAVELTGADEANYQLPEKTTKAFTIKRKGLDNDKDGNGNAVIALNPTEYTYDGTAKEPAVTVTDRDTGKVVPQSEYAVTYSDNVDAGTAKVKISDAAGGNYNVVGSARFTIARRKATVTAIDQQVKTVDDVKRGVEAVKAEGLAKGQALKSVKLNVSVKTGAEKGEIIPENAKIADAKGKDVTGNYELSYVAGSLTLTQKPGPEPGPDPDPDPAKPDYTLLAVMKTCGNRALRVSWTRVPGADGYEVTFVKEDRSFKNAEVVSIRSLNTCKFTGLKKNTAYKAYVRSWKYEGNARTYIGRKSPVVCAITGDVRKNKTNAARVSVDASRVKLNVGERKKVSATVKGVKRGKKVMRWENALLRWYSSDANVAVVNAKGKIRAVGAGECTVYALAANGVRGAVKVKVK